MAVYITEKERNALLDATDFISGNADGAANYEPFAQMQEALMSLFHKAKKDAEKQRQRKLVNKYLREARSRSKNS